MTSHFLCDDHIPGSVPCANCEPDPRFLPSPDPMSAPTSTPETRTISWLRSELDKAHAGLAKAREALKSAVKYHNVTLEAADAAQPGTVAELTERLVAASSEWDDNTGDDEGPTSRPYLEHLAKAVAQHGTVTLPDDWRSLQKWLDDLTRPATSERDTAETPADEIGFADQLFDADDESPAALAAAFLTGALKGLVTKEAAHYFARSMDTAGLLADSVRDAAPEPVSVEARHLAEETDDDEAHDIAIWCGGSYLLDGDGTVEVPTADGTVTADSGSLIVKLSDGTFRVKPMPTGARVVTICGSMRFFGDMLKAAEEETAAGRIVLAPFSVVAPEDQGGEFKQMLDDLHRRKIDLSSEIIVVTRDGYIGESTRGEIAYAEQTGKTVRHFPASERNTDEVARRAAIRRMYGLSAESLPASADTEGGAR